MSLKYRMIVAVCSLLTFLLGSRQKVKIFFSMSPACTLISGIGRVVSGADLVSSLGSFSLSLSSSSLFPFFISGLLPCSEPSDFCALRGCRTTLAFVVGVVCPRDVILPISGDPPAGILQRGIALRPRSLSPAAYCFNSRA